MFFYLYSGLSSFLVLVGSCIIIILIYKALGKVNKGRKALLVTGIVINIIPLIVFKYTDFFNYICK